MDEKFNTKILVQKVIDESVDEQRNDLSDTGKLPIDLG